MATSKAEQTRKQIRKSGSELEANRKKRAAERLKNKKAKPE